MSQSKLCIFIDSFTYVEFYAYFQAYNYRNIIYDYETYKIKLNAILQK